MGRMWDCGCNASEGKGWSPRSGAGAPGHAVVSVERPRQHPEAFDHAYRNVLATGHDHSQSSRAPIGRSAAIARTFGLVLCHRGTVGAGTALNWRPCLMMN